MEKIYEIEASSTADWAQIFNLKFIKELAVVLMKFHLITVLIIANNSIKIKLLYLHNFNKYMYFKQLKYVKSRRKSNLSEKKEYGIIFMQ